jgi:Domain of unknown function (DU1801)
MYEAKTKPTDLSVSDYLNAIEDETRRKDCKQLAALMKKVSGCPAKMWGASIVGFDSYHYQYASGHQGDCCIIGFSSRKNDISVYMLGGYDSDEAKKLLAQLGKHKVGKACMNIRQLADIELSALEKLLARSLAETKRRYPTKK